MVKDVEAGQHGGSIDYTHDLIEQHIQTIAAVTVAIPQVTNAVEYYSLNAFLIELSQDRVYRR
jgi:hypothetical protein